MPAEADTTMKDKGTGPDPIPATGPAGAASGITPTSVVTALGLLLLLGLYMPYWGMVKSYQMGLGGYLPLEAFFLTLALLAFNRFRGGLALVAGLVAVAIFVPPWHAALNARTDDAIKTLPALAHWMRLAFMKPIESSQETLGMPGALVGLGALAVFAAGAGLFRGVAALLPALRRRLGWREIVTVFVVLAVGTYSFKSVTWLVGALHLPFKYDSEALNFKGKFLRPVPVDQERIDDPAVKKALEAVEANPAAIRTDPVFAGSRVRGTLEALERLRDDSKNPDALAFLREEGWGPEAARALQLLAEASREGESAVDPSGELAALCAKAAANAALYAREEALFEVCRYNAAGIPTFLLPYDLHVYDRRSFEGNKRYEAEIAALQAYGRGFAKRAPDPPKIGVPRFADYEFDKERLKATGFNAAQDPALRRLSGVYLADFEAGGVSHGNCRVAEVGANWLDLKRGLSDSEDTGEKAERAKVMLSDITAGGFRTALIAAYEQDAARYMEKYRSYQGELARARSEAWTAFLSHWKKPLRWWLPLLALVLCLQFFLAAMLRRQWCDHEKLMFPHAEAVRSIVEGDDAGARTRRVLSSWTFWAGFGLAAAIMIFQGLSAYFPAVPAPDINRVKLDTFLTEKPWTDMEKTLNFQPFMIGIAYLLTAEVSLSMWVFALINQGLRVGASAWGLPRSECWAIHGEQVNSDALYTGAMVVFVLSLLWGGRRHIGYLFRRGLGLTGPDQTERAEPMSSPMAFWGFWLSLAGILGWCALVGLKMWIMVVILGFYLILLVLMCRVVSEAGALTAGCTWWPFYPHGVFCHLFGFGQAASFGKTLAFRESWLAPGGGGSGAVASTLRCVGVFQVVWPAMLYNLQLTPFVLAGFKLTETEPRRKRMLTVLTALGLFGTAALFLYGTLDNVFATGADNAQVPAFNRMANWAFGNSLMRDVVGAERMWSPDKFRMTMMGTGGVVMAALLLLRSTFYWWPLHPLGMAAYGLEFGIWINFFVGWLVKRTALSYGGGTFSQKLNPLFYGLICGHLMTAGFWALVGICGSGTAGGMQILPAVGW